MAHTQAEKQAEKERCIGLLRDHLKQGDRIYNVQTHYTNSGRHSVKLLTIYKGEIFDLAYEIARALDYKMDPDHGGLKCQDPHTVIYHLGRLLWGKDAGYALRLRN